MLNKKYRYPSKRLYQLVAHSRIRIYGKYCSVRAILLENDHNTNHPYFAIIINKKLGYAVKRNKHRRRLRAILYQHFRDLKKPYYIMYIAKVIDNIPFKDLTKDTIETVGKALQQVNTST